MRTILCRDFNAHCGNENDFVIDDLDDFVPIDSYYVAVYSKSRVRHNKDSKLDLRGKELLDFCIGKKLHILNGRLLGDSWGNFTWFNVHGQSVVDYFASEELLRFIITFKVSGFSHLLSASSYSL